MSSEDTFNTIVIGGSQAGLAAGYYLTQRGENYIILDAHRRTGETWRNRWDSLRLFTPSQNDYLPGMKFPGKDYYFPTKDEAADFRPDCSWINLPIFDEEGRPRHARGVVREAAEIYFVGLHFQTGLTSSLLGGVGEDARSIVRQIR